MKLQKLLAEARRAMGATLRDVERATGVSNAYLSQMESGHVAEPSPRKLQALAEYYGLSYDTLMNSCGYATRTPPIAAADSTTFFVGEELRPETPEESAAVTKLLRDLRARRTGLK